MGGQKILHTEPKAGTAYALLRKIALEVYGNKCEWCGESETPLQFDHVHGGGDIDRQRNRVNSMIRKIAHGGVRLESPRLQLLCAPCHRSKSALENVHRHMRARGIITEAPTKATSANSVQGDAKIILDQLLRSFT